MFNSRKQYLELIDTLYKSGLRKNLFITNPDFWPIVRIQLSYLCHLLYSGNEIWEPSPLNFSAVNFNKKFSLVKDRLYIFLLSLKYKSILKDKILLAGFNNNKNEDNINPYIHPVQKMLNKTGIQSALFFFRNITDKTTENELSDLFYAIHGFQQGKYFSGNNNCLVELLQKIKNEIKENFSYEFFPDDFIENAGNIVANAIIQKQILLNSFAHFFSITKPNAIWTYCFYDIRMQSLILAANKLKITTVEYQHSAQGDEHFAYSGWEDMDTIKEYFPFNFWVWRKSDGEMIKKKFSGKNFRPGIVVGGNIFLAMEKINVQHAKKDVSKMPGILVSLQGMWVPSFIEEAVAKHPEFTWYFRMHPRYSNDKLKLAELKSNFPDRVETDCANNLPLYKLFPMVKYNLTSFSGTAIEAQAFNVQNVIFTEEGKRAYKNMIDHEAFLFAGNLDELENILDNSLTGDNFDFNSIETDISLMQNNLKNLVSNPVNE